MGPSLGFGSASYFSFLVLLDMQASIACVLGLVTCQRNIHIWETVRNWLEVAFAAFSRTGLKLIFFDISVFKHLPPPHTFYKHIVAVKATIDKQSPHSKLLLKSRVF